MTRRKGPAYVVLGCGPAGLIAAHALATAGQDFVIFSNKRVSPMYGAQLLERPIPGVSEENPTAVVSTMRGTMAAYADKVYGPDPQRVVYDREQDHKRVTPEGWLEWSLSGWDIRRAYAALWDRYADAVVPWTGDHRSVAGLRLAWPAAQFISTIPAKLLCQGFCTFTETYVWATGTWEGGTDEDNRVYFSVDPDPAQWYRTARIHGFATTEWPDGPVKPHPEAVRIVKPQATDCTCFPEIVRMGRFGYWGARVLAHEAWDQTLDLVAKKEKESAA